MVGLQESQSRGTASSPPLSMRLRRTAAGQVAVSRNEQRDEVRFPLSKALEEAYKVLAEPGCPWRAEVALEVFLRLGFPPQHESEFFPKRLRGATNIAERCLSASVAPQGCCCLQLPRKRAYLPPWTED